MLTSPRTVHEISHSSVLAEQGRLIAFPNWPLNESGAKSRTLAPYLAGLDELPTWLADFFPVGLFTS